MGHQLEHRLPHPELLKSIKAAERASERPGLMSQPHALTRTHLPLSWTLSPPYSGIPAFMSIPSKGRRVACKSTAHPSVLKLRWARSLQPREGGA